MSAQKVDHGEENSPTAPAGTRTRGLSLIISMRQAVCHVEEFTSPALSQTTSKEVKSFFLFFFFFLGGITLSCCAASEVAQKRGGNLLNNSI